MSSNRKSTLTGGSKGDSKSSASASSKTHGIQKKLSDAKSTALISTSNHPATASKASQAWPDFMFINELNNLVKSYLAYDVQISLGNLNRYFIWSNDEVTLYNKAYEIARDHVLKADGKPAKSKATIVVVDEKNSDAPPPPADPFTALDAAVTADPRVLLPQITITVKRDGVDHTFQGTLETIAMANLGHTVASENRAKPMVSEGRAERLRGLRERLLAHTVPLALEQARLALPKQQDVKAIKAKEKALNAAFDRIKEKKPAEAQTILINYVINTKPAVITDGSYYINLLQTFIDGLNILLARGSKELPGNWYGPLGDQYFCALGMILRPFSMDLREILMTGAWNVLRDGQPVARGQDTSDRSFIGLAGCVDEVGVFRSYDDIGRRWASMAGGGAYTRARFIRLMSAITSAQQVLCCDRTFNRRTTAP